MVDAQTNEQMTDKQLHDEAMTMFLAGSETTASILEWIAFYLTEHPEIKARAYAEYRVLQEGMRMRPPGYWLPRRAVEADEIDDYYIPKHSMVMVMTQLIHYHPEIWKNPGEFDPDRFLPEAITSRHQMSWLPFGSGQRQCIDGISDLWKVSSYSPVYYSITSSSLRQALMSGRSMARRSAPLGSRWF